MIFFGFFLSLCMWLYILYVDVYFVCGCIFCMWLYILYVVVYFVCGCIFCTWLYILYVVVYFVYGSFNSLSYVLLLLRLCILIVIYILFCLSCFHRANWHSSAALTEVFPCFFLSCKVNARV